MKILHSVASLDSSSGGPARSVPQLALAQARCGVEVALWSPMPVGDRLPDLPKDANALISLFSGDFQMAVREFGMPDLVHDHGIWLPCHRVVAQVCATHGIPRIVAARGMLEPWALNHKKWKKRLAWHLYQKRDLESAAALHATAEQEAIQYRKLGLKAPVLVAANGVGFDSVVTHVSSKKVGKTALFLSRLHPKKGLTMFIQAWADLMPDDWKMRVVGPDEGGHLQELQQQVRAAGLEDIWSFEDSLEGDAKWTAMAEADLFILPSHSENFGIVVAEALASGTPVITTTGTPWAGLLEHQCGWWVEPEVDALAEALNAATALNQETRRAMGHRGRDWVAEEFAWPAIAEKTLEFYRCAIDGFLNDE